MSDTSTESAPQGAAPAAPSGGGSNGLIIRLVIFLVVGVAVYFSAPWLMTQFFFQEELAKQKASNVVGRESDAKPPPGYQIYGQQTPGPGGGRARANAEGGEGAKDADSKDKEPAKETDAGKEAPAEPAKPAGEGAATEEASKP